MSFLSTILNFFGTKSDRDMKELVPSVKEMLALETNFNQLSNNQLRDKTLDFKSKIHLVIQEFNDQIEDLKKKSEDEKIRENKEEILNNFNYFGTIWTISASDRSHPSQVGGRLGYNVRTLPPPP